MIIDREFKNLLPPLDEREYQILERDIIDNGCRDPLIVWGETLVDGHNRYAICQDHDIEFSTKEMQFSDRDEAMNWIDNNQLGRRNLNPEQFILVVGRMYERVKKASHRPEQKGCQSVTLSTAEKIADEHGVSSRTVKRAGKLARSIEKLKDVDPDLEYSFTAGKAPSREKIVKAAAVVDEDPEAAKEILHPEKAEPKIELGSNVMTQPEKGLKLAQQAVSILNKISVDDKFRDEGFKYVMKWIKANK